MLFLSRRTQSKNGVPENGRERKTRTISSQKFTNVLRETLNKPLF